MPDIPTSAGQLTVAGPEAVLALSPAMIVPDDIAIAWEGAKKHMTKHSDIAWMMSRYVHAGPPPNRNGHLFHVEHLPASYKLIPGTPTNVLHRAQHVVGTTVAAEMLYPPPEEGAETAGAEVKPFTDSPYVETLCALWKRPFAAELRAIQAAHDRGALWVSMECNPGAGPGGTMAEGVSCFVCGHTAAWDGYSSESYCAHLNERRGMWLNHPLFLGTGIILPPARPGWADADVLQLQAAARANPALTEQIAGDLQIAAASASLTDAEAELMAAALAVRSGIEGDADSGRLHFVPASGPGVVSVVAARLVQEFGDPTASTIEEAIAIVEAQDRHTEPVTDAAQLTINLSGIHGAQDPGFDHHMMMLVQRHLVDLPAASYERWPTFDPVAKVVELLIHPDGAAGAIKSTFEGPYSASWFLEGPGWAAAINGYDGSSWTVVVAATTPAFARRLLDGIALIRTPPPPRVPIDDRVPLAIWTEGPMGGGRRRWTWLRTQGWADISANYPSALRVELEKAALTLPDPADGNFQILGGDAGTGKTRFLEAGMTKWAYDADVCIVADPDRLFRSTSYLADVLAAGSQRRQVVVAEDVDDLVRAGDKNADVARMINSGDGILGRATGSGTLFSLTANLKLAQMASYVTRDGRASVKVEFCPFPREEAVAWLEAHDADASSVNGPRTLSQLYSILKAQTQKKAA
jgi:hypothetical protein